MIKIIYLISLFSLAHASYLTSCEKALEKKQSELTTKNINSIINRSEEKITYTIKDKKNVLRSISWSCHELLYSTSCHEVPGASEYARKCEDGTVSYYQPSKNPGVKSKKSSYEGLCGPTAAANLAYAYCKKNYFYTLQIAGRYFNDITPGVRPDTLASGLNELFEKNAECMVGTWKYYYHTNRYDFMDSLFYKLNKGQSYITKSRKDGTKRKISPMAVLISKDQEILHWVTVVDVYNFDTQNGLYAYEDPNCLIAFNEFGKQSTAKCSSFVKWANQVDDSALTSVLPEYITVVFEPSSFGNIFKMLHEKIKK